MDKLKAALAVAGRVALRRRVLAGIVAAVLAIRGATMSPEAQDQLVNALMAVFSAIGG